MASGTVASGSATVKGVLQRDARLHGWRRSRYPYCRIAIDAASNTAARVAPMLAMPLPAMS